MSGIYHSFQFLTSQLACCFEPDKNKKWGASRPSCFYTRTTDNQRLIFFEKSKLLGFGRQIEPKILVAFWVFLANLLAPISVLLVPFSCFPYSKKQDFISKSPKNIWVGDLNLGHTKLGMYPLCVRNPCFYTSGMEER
jgi:hypothetical protein